MSVEEWVFLALGVVVGVAALIYTLMLLLLLLGLIGDNAKELLSWLEEKLPGGS